MGVMENKTLGPVAVRLLESINKIHGKVSIGMTPEGVPVPQSLIQVLMSNRKLLLLQMQQSCLVTALLETMLDRMSPEEQEIFATDAATRLSEVCVAFEQAAENLAKEAKKSSLILPNKPSGIVRGR